METPECSDGHVGDNEHLFIDTNILSGCDTKNVLTLTFWIIKWNLLCLFPTHYSELVVLCLKLSRSAFMGRVSVSVHSLFSKSQMHNSGRRDQKFHSFSTVYLQCQHLRLLLGFGWGCSDFPSWKSKLRERSRKKFHLGTQKF